ncbi:MAG: sulfotransferase domain-containing protein [Pseudorhodoplanes sp.]|nr:sulfotransferase domain-containing protein [Pseudorhodoplanes sp.]
MSTSLRSLSPEYFNPLSRADVVLPSVLVIGAQRAGTTSLHEYLSQHPSLFASRRKEVHYFDIHYGKGSRWYASNFPTRKYAEEKAGSSTQYHSFETTPYYLYHPLAPARAAQMLPHAKIIVLFRNPISRAYSHYLNEVRKGYEKLTFADALAAEDERLRGESEKLINQPSYYSYNHQHYSYVDRGRYAAQVEHWLKYFPRNQFLFLRSEDLFQNPGKTLNEIAEFLNIAPFPERDYERLNASVGQEKLDRSIRERLSREFSSHNTRLGEIANRSFDWPD